MLSTGGTAAATLKAMLDVSIQGKLDNIRRKNEEWKQKQMRFRAMIAARRSHIADCRYACTPRHPHRLFVPPPHNTSTPC